MALFITFEGGEGSGKSTQAKMLYRRLCRKSIPALLIHEPGITSLGKKIAHILKWAQEVDISPVAELLLFNVSRSQLVTEVIRPQMESGKVVICDRYSDSTTAYQGYGRRIDLNVVATVNSIGMLGLKPDLTILMDIPVEVGLERKSRGKLDRFEKEAVSFHKRVREGYFELSDAEPKRWLLVDATRQKKEVAKEIWDRVSKLLPV